MKLNSIQHLFKKKNQVAWAGSGGKSTLMFTIANQFFNNALISTSTHLGIEERELVADKIDLFDSPVEVFLQRPKLTENLLVYKGVEEPEHLKLNAPQEDELELLSKWCEKNSSPFFIEADGSKRTPIKAPDTHEPAIPSWVDTVCVVAGLGSLGKVINEETVFRFPIFNKITHANVGEVLTLDHLFTYLTNSKGGLKNIPLSAKKILFLHQADLIKSDETIYEFCYRLRAHYDHVVLSSFTNNEITIHAHYGKTAGIILAAGQAKRFGSPKQLALWKNKPFIQHTIHNAIQSKLQPIKVVLGAYANQIIPSIQKEPIEIIINPNWEKGQSTSVNLGIQSLPKDVDSVIFLLVDQPQLTSEHTKKIIHLFAQTKANIIAYEYKNSCHHPILFSAAIFSEFSELSGDVGGRKLFNKYPPLAIKTDDPIHAFDIDTPEDLANISYNP